jgi:hypothetical protein
MNFKPKSPGSTMPIPSQSQRARGEAEAFFMEHGINLK